MNISCRPVYETKPINCGEGLSAKQEIVEGLMKASYPLKAKQQRITIA